MIFRSFLFAMLFFNLLHANFSWVPFDAPIAATGTVPKVATDGSGHALAVWREGTTSMKASYFNGTSWGTAATLQSGGSGLTNPSVAMDTSENGIAVWRSSLTLGDVMVSIYDPEANSWSSPVQVSQVGTIPPDVFPVVNVDNNGKAMVVFSVEEVDLNAKVFGRDYTFATDTWNPPLASSPTLLSPTDENVRGDSFSLATFANGSSISAGLFFTAQIGLKLFGNTITNSSDFGPTLVDTDGVGIWPPALAGISTTNIVGIWATAGSGNKHISWARINDFSASSWTTSVDPIPGSTNETVDEPAIAMDSNGDAYAVWIAGDGVNEWIQYSKYDSSQQEWSTAEDISEESNATNPRISVDSTGTVIILWQEEGAILGRRNVAGTWDPLLAESPTTISATGTSPSLAILPGEANSEIQGFQAAADDAFAVWQENGGIYGALGENEQCPNLLDFLLDEVGNTTPLPENPTVQDLLDVYRGKR